MQSAQPNAKPRVKPYSVKGWAIYRLGQLSKEHGLPLIRPHDLRRTMAHKTYSVTSDLRVVQSLLGHESLNTTFHYLQPSQLRAPRAAVADAVEHGRI